jgi:predicted transcriptional regulator
VGLYVVTMPEEETRVEFNAPESLVHQADVLADVLDISRTRLLVDALREEIDERLTDEGVQRRLRAAYYDGPVDFETVEALLGTEEAMRLQLLRASLDRDPPEPRIETTPPSREEFYSEPPSVWAPDTAHPSEQDGTDGE